MFEMVALKRADCCIRKACSRHEEGRNFLSSESVESATLPLQSVDHVHGGNGLPLGVLGVGDGIPDDERKPFAMKNFFKSFRAVESVATAK